MFRMAFPSFRPLGTARRQLTTPQHHRAVARSVLPPLQRQPASSAFSTSIINLASQRELVVKNLRKSLGPDYASRTLPASLILSTLRDMRIERSLNNHPERFSFIHKQESNMYRDGHRAIALLAENGKERLSIGEIETVLTDDNGVTWALIRELLETGKVKRLENLSDDKKVAVLFHRIHGIGGTKADKLVKAGYKSLADLREIPADSKQLTKAQKIGLQHLDDMEAMIPQSEVTVFKDLIGDALAKEDSSLHFEIMGSYRRNELISSDVDVVVWHDSWRHLRDEVPEELLEKVSRAMFRAGLLQAENVFSLGTKKLSGLTRLPHVSKARYRQLDVRLAPAESLPYMLLGNTGDDELMKILRRCAIGKGWVLNEYCMGTKDNSEESKTSTWPIAGTELICKTEQEIFKHLGVPYLEPTQRSYRDYCRILPRHLL